MSGGGTAGKESGGCSFTSAEILFLFLPRPLFLAYLLLSKPAIHLLAYMYDVPNRGMLDSNSFSSFFLFLLLLLLFFALFDSFILSSLSICRSIYIDISAGV